jgi:hypothetical protein
MEGWLAVAVGSLRGKATAVGLCYVFTNNNGVAAGGEGREEMPEGENENKKKVRAERPKKVHLCRYVCR